jgi:hypothetical protein
MDESSLIIMEMDAIFGFDIGSDIAPGYLFHIEIIRKVDELSTHIESKVSMPVDHIRSWSEYIGREYCSYDDEDPEKMFFHTRRIRKNHFFSRRIIP